MIFEIKEDKAIKLKAKEFKHEFEMHQFIDNNLFELFGIRFITNEHRTKIHGRIETLGLDNRNRPVVIEYKKNIERGQLVQANKYLRWIQQNPADFELLVRKKLKIDDEIDFYNPKIICVAKEYDIDDKELEFSLKIEAELWKYQYYENGIFIIEREAEAESGHNFKVSKKTVKIDKIEIVTKQDFQDGSIKPIEKRLKESSEDIRDLYYKLNDKILSLNSQINQYTSQEYFGYRCDTSYRFIELNILKNSISLLLRTKDNFMKDPKNLTEKVTGFGRLDRKTSIDPSKINSEYSLDDFMDLIIQSIEALDPPRL
ncbi:MAG: hypothetical protein WCP85_21125 [Mariniphaga sp.]